MYIWLNAFYVYRRGNGKRRSGGVGGGCGAHIICASFMCRVGIQVASTMQNQPAAGMKNDMEVDKHSRRTRKKETRRSSSKKKEEEEEKE